MVLFIDLKIKCNKKSRIDSKSKHCIFSFNFQCEGGAIHTPWEGLREIEMNWKELRGIFYYFYLFSIFKVSLKCTQINREKTERYELYIFPDTKDFSRIF